MCALYQTVTAGSSSQEKSSESEPSGPAEQEKNHSNSSTLSDRRGSNSSLCSIEEEHRSVYDMVHCILLSTRDNVNFVNEVFHQVRRNADSYSWGFRRERFLSWRMFYVTMLPPCGQVFNIVLQLFTVLAIKIFLNRILTIRPASRWLGLILYAYNAYNQT